jgi:hypothetical protein
MFKKISVVVAVLCVVALSGLLMSCGTGSNRPAGILYVVSQSLANVSSFSLDLASGNLSLITEGLANTCPSSATCGLPLTATLDPSHNVLRVLSQSFISGLTVNSDGSLSLDQNGGTAMTAGQTALAMAPTAAGDFLFVVSAGSNPNASDCNADGGYVLNSDCPTISVFSTKPGSTAVTLTGNNCAALSGPCPYSLSRIPTSISVLTFTPSGGSQQTIVVVSSNHDLTPAHNDSQVSVFLADSSGNLTEQSASPYTALAPNPLSVQAVNTNPVGQPTLGGVFVYVGSQAAVTGSVTGWEVCTQVDADCSQTDVNNENLAPIKTMKPLSVGQNPIAFLVDPTNTFLYVACNVGNNVYAFKMTTSTGVLTPLAPPLEPSGGAGPVTLAMHPSSNNSNEFLYVANNGSSTLVEYVVNLTTGDLSNPLAPLIFTAGNPYGMAAK